MTQLDLIDVPKYDPEKPQWFTPPELARDLARWALAVPYSMLVETVLEPAAGSGALVDAWLEQADDFTGQVDTCEIDPRWAAHLSSRYEDDDRVSVWRGDFLSIPPVSFRYNLALMNPPYEDGAACDFLRRSMDLSSIVVGIFQTSTLQGVRNVETIWSDQLWSWKIRLYKRRPRFSGTKSTAERDFCAVKGWRCHDGEARTLELEWW